MSCPKSSLLFAIALGTFIFAAGRAEAWGQLVYTDDDAQHIESTLIYKAIKNGKINYFVSIDPSATQLYDANSIATQIEFIVKAWWAPVKEANGLSDLVVTRLRNWENNPRDLIVYFEPVPADQQSTGGYSDYHDTPPWSEVHIQSNYKYVDDTKTYSIVDFAQFLRTGETLPTLLQSFAFRAPGYAYGDFANDRGMDDGEPVYFSSYAYMLHEIGHTFGLCDLSNNGKDNCDVNHMSPVVPAEQPPSVMNLADFVSLTDDDKAGVQSLYARFKNWAPSAPAEPGLNVPHKHLRIESRFTRGQHEARR